MRIKDALKAYIAYGVVQAGGDDPALRDTCICCEGREPRVLSVHRRSLAHIAHYYWITPKILTKIMTFARPRRKRRAEVLQLRKRQQQDREYQQWAREEARRWRQSHNRPRQELVLVPLNEPIYPEEAP